MSPYRLLRPLLFALAPEAAHALTVRALRLAGPGRMSPPDPRLATELAGLRLASPVGLAAGFDKNGQCPDAILGRGFGFAEIGTVTPRPQPGNPRPRMFRLVEDEAVINRLGFNNDGMDRVARRLDRRTQGHAPGILGINLGANRDSADRQADYAAAIARLAPYADYLTLNVSSPNTPGLRALQSADQLARLIALARDARDRVVGARPCPLFLKVAPDLTDADVSDIAALAGPAGIDALIVSNTTVDRPAGLQSRHRDEAGGLSGRPLMRPSTALLASFYRRTNGGLPLVGVGGVFSAADAYEKIRAGAAAVQLYTGLVYEGPGLVRRITEGLVECLDRDGFGAISEAVGCDHRV